MKARLEKISFVPGEKFRLFLTWSHADIKIDDICNMNMNIYRADIKRNNLLLGSGTNPTVSNSELVLEVTVPNTSSSGLYFVSETRLVQVGDEHLNPTLRIPFEPIWFEIRTHVQQPATQADLVARKKEIVQKRHEFANKIHTTATANGDPSCDKIFSVAILGVGCLVHGMQQLEGYRINPVSGGMSHRRLLELMNTFLENEGHDGLPFLEKTEEQYQHSTPTLAVTYSRVRASDHVDALNHCREHCQTVFQVLGIARGQIPREFAYIIMEHKTANRWHGFETPHYRGNLAPDFNPSGIAQSVEAYLPKLEANPFTRLLVKSYSEATGELDFGFRILRYWTVLELAADKLIARGQDIFHPDGSAIQKTNGKPETTGSKHGRVYQYILQNEVSAQIMTVPDGEEHRTIIIGDQSDPRYKPGMTIFRLWDMVRAIYAIRCAVAHEGYFDTNKRSSPGEVLASDLLAAGHPNLMNFVSGHAQRAIWRDS